MNKNTQVFSPNGEPMAPPHKIELLRISFNLDLAPFELSAFRGAIGNIVGENHVLFHHHKGEKSYRYAYPLIQYRFIGKYPSIICIDQGIWETQSFFEKLGKEIHIYKSLRPISVAKTQYKIFPLQVWKNASFSYIIRKWIPFNNKNYRQYFSYPEDSPEREDLLRRILIGNILSFAKGVGWHIRFPIEISELKVLKQQQIVFKVNPRVRKTAFLIRVKTNVYIPHFIGLGKGVSRGFGGIIPK